MEATIIIKNGARFYKTDLHIHTEASTCWQGNKDEKELEGIFKKLKQEGIEVVAITDHNTVQNIDKSKQLGKKYDIVVFPGVEVSTKEGHVLAIFDPRKKTEDIQNWLIGMKLGTDERGDAAKVASEQDGSQLGIAKVFYLIDNAEGIAIAPHPNTKACGFMGIMKNKGVARKEAYNSPYLRGLEVGGSRETHTELAMGKVPGYPKKYGMIEGSDAHCISEIGKNYTYIKIGDFGIDALKQVFYDPSMRIIFSGEWKPKTHMCIKSIEASQGFFNGLTFTMHPDMNCLVGGKAVGKSLLVELIRFGLGITSPIESIDVNSNDMIRAKTCLGNGGTVTLHIVGRDGENYRIQRTLSSLDQGPEVYYENTQTKAVSDVREVFDCQIYSQNEVIELGKSLPALLEWLDGFIDLSGEYEKIKELKHDIKKAIRKLDDKHNLAKKVDSLKDKKTELERKKALLYEKVEDEVLKDFPNWQKEDRYLKKTLVGLDDFEKKVIGNLRKTKIDDFFPSPEEGMPNKKELEDERGKLVELSETVVEAVELLEKKMVSMRKGIKSYITEWMKKYEKKKDAHSKIIQELVETAGIKNASALTSELNKVIQAIEKVNTELEEATKAAKEKAMLENTLRNTLLPNYATEHGNVFGKRLAKAKSITDKVNSFVRIQVRQMDDRTKFEKELIKKGKGSNLRKDQLEKIANKITPVELGEMILDKDSSVLARKTGVKKGNIDTLIDHIWDNATNDDGFECPSEIYSVMLTELEDSVTVELQVEQDVYKPMHQLSGGSKCTAILSVALVEGSCPLIVDQPEDALDNPFVFEKIVQSVRRTKMDRQYIFATHNPNIAVASDADLIYCLKASAQKGSIDKHGSIDEITTRDKVVANLEGGQKAFRLRSQKYDITIDDPNAVVLDIQ